MKVWIPHLAMIASLLALVPVAACGPASTSQPAPVTVTVHLASATPDSLHLVWRFELQDQWYLYGPFRNDTGFAPTVVLDLPEGWTAGPLRFPVPTRKVLPGDILDHVYHGELLLTQSIATSATPTPSAPLQATINWLACKDLCVPGQATLTVPVRDPSPQAEGIWTRALAVMPRPLDDGTVVAERREQAIILSVPEAARLVFIPAEDAPLFENLIADGATDGAVLSLRLRPGPTAQAALSGLLSIDYKNGDKITGTLTLR